MQVKPLPEFTRAPHSRDLSSNLSAIQSMLSYLSDHASISIIDAAIPARLNLCLKQVKSGVCSLADVITAFLGLPWRQVFLDEPHVSKRLRRDEDETLIVDTKSETVDDLASVVIEADHPMSVLNDALVVKRVGILSGRCKATISKESMNLLERIVKGYMCKMCERVSTAAVARVQSQAENYNHCIVTSNPESELKLVEDKEKHERLERIKAAVQAKPQSHSKTNPDVRTAIKRAMNRGDKRESEVAVVVTPSITKTEKTSLMVTVADVRSVLETEPMWRRSSLLQRVFMLGR